MLIAGEGENPIAIEQVQLYLRTVRISPFELNAEIVRKERPELFIIFTFDYDRLATIINAHKEIFANPLSIIWCPESDIISGNDLQRSATQGIDYIFIDECITDLTLARINGRLSANNQCRRMYQSDSVFGEQTNYVSRDEEFMKRIIKYLGEHNHRHDFSIEKMGKDLGMSRTNFFSRIKSLTGNSPSKLVMNFRLKKAAHLLLSTDRNISEIAFEVGFSSTAYFTRCFKEMFGTNPSKYTRERQSKSNLNSSSSVSVEGVIA